MLRGNRLFTPIACLRCLKKLPTTSSSIRAHKNHSLIRAAFPALSVNNSQWIFTSSVDRFSKMAQEKEPWEKVMFYWFDELKSNKERLARWFSGAKGKEEIEEQFADLVQKARNGELKSWEETPRGTLAVITLLDQFCRTLYKGTADSFSHDPVANRLVKKFLPGGPFNHKDLPIYVRFMLYVPLEHSENIDDQNLCYKLYEELIEDCKTEEDKGVAKSGLDYSRQHREIVAKYGRFPKRNAAIGRKNTPEEEEFLKDNPYAF